MFVINRHFVDANAIVLLNAVRRKCVDIGLCRFLIELLIEKPAGEVAQDDLDAQFQKTCRAVNADKTGAEDHDILFGLRHFLENLDVVDVAESDHVRRTEHILDRREESMGAGRDQELVVGNSLVSVQDHFLLLPVEADRLSALHPVDFIERFKIFLDKTQSLDRSLSCQILVKNAAGVYVLVLGDQDDLTLLVKSAQLPDGVDTRRGGTDDNILHIISPPRE